RFNLLHVEAMQDLNQRMNGIFQIVAPLRDATAFPLLLRDSRELFAESVQVIVKIDQVVNERLLERFVEKVIAILQHFGMQRIEHLRRLASSEAFFPLPRSVSALLQQTLLQAGLLSSCYYFAPKNFRIASTKPSRSCRRASMSILRPRSVAVFDVIGPMLATCMPFGHGSPSARKFSTVEELVNVIRSAPSSKNRRRAPVTSRVSGTVRYAKPSSTIAPSFESSLGSTSRAFSARARRIRRFSTPPCF